MTAYESVYELDHEQFKHELAKRTTPQMIFNHSREIYGYLSGLFRQDCIDSVLREWAFQWASEQLKIDYDIIYKRWVG